MKDLKEMVSGLSDYFTEKPSEFLLGLALMILIVALLYVAFSI